MAALVFSLLFLVLSGLSYGQRAEKVRLVFSMNINKDIYLDTVFGEPPQIAVWLEQSEGRVMRTVWVARRAGRRWWKGKVECPVALPYWESRHRQEKSEYKARGLLKRFVDAVTGATPTGGPFSVDLEMKAGEVWDFFIEVNLSADFNAAFPQRDETGLPDPEVNGQPSIIYMGKITALPGRKAVAKLIGRSDQWAPVDELLPDLEGITTAREILSNVEARCEGLR